MTTDQKQKITYLLEKTKVAVISTNSPDDLAPESATIMFSETPELHVIFGSYDYRRKNKNIFRNPKVSMVIGFDLKEMKTIQLEGVAKILSDKERIEEFKDLHYKKNPGSEKYRKEGKREYVEVTPSWIRYSDFGLNPPEVWEINL